MEQGMLAALLQLLAQDRKEMREMAGNLLARSGEQFGMMLDLLREGMKSSEKPKKAPRKVKP